MKFTVMLGDPEASYPVEIDARDRRAFERDALRMLQLKGSLRDIINAYPETYTAWLAWHALCRRTRTLDITWEDFDSRLVAMDTDEDEDEDSDDGMDPTKSGATPD